MIEKAPFKMMQDNLYFEHTTRSKIQLRFKLQISASINIKLRDLRLNRLDYAFSCRKKVVNITIYRNFIKILANS